MALNPTQLLALKAYIAGVPAWDALPNNSDTAYSIATELNQDASPDYIVWRNDVRADEIGDAWNGTDIDGMSSLNMQRLQLLLASSAGGTFDMGRVDRRAGFENPFGTNVNGPSRVAMRAAWKRKAKLGEKVFATGSGTDASPSVMDHVGNIAWPDVQTARSM
jgi:hypothetical protein